MGEESEAEGRVEEVFLVEGKVREEGGEAVFEDEFRGEG